MLSFWVWMCSESNGRAQYKLKKRARKGTKKEEKVQLYVIDIDGFEIKKRIKKNCLRASEKNGENG